MRVAYTKTYFVYTDCNHSLTTVPVSHLRYAECIELREIVQYCCKIQPWP